MSHQSIRPLDVISQGPTKNLVLSRYAVNAEWVEQCGSGQGWNEAEHLLPPIIMPNGNIPRTSSTHYSWPSQTALSLSMDYCSCHYLTHICSCGHVWPSQLNHELHYGPKLFLPNPSSPLPFHRSQTCIMAQGLPASASSDFSMTPNCWTSEVPDFH